MAFFVMGRISFFLLKKRNFKDRKNKLEVVPEKIFGKNMISVFFILLMNLSSRLFLVRELKDTLQKKIFSVELLKVAHTQHCRQKLASYHFDLQPGPRLSLQDFLSS
ncbi:hypothetical protein ISU91_21470 [Leptospira borgpetersenii serovar Hardjo-bovis]|nr:hypothetical protein [Leptospira borgpetersenii serovar Hardjo-bovis]